MRFEVARLFGVLPISLLALPMSEYTKMRRYYLKYREALESPDGGGDAPSDGVIIE